MLAAGWSSASRRKQARPRHLRSEEQEEQEEDQEEDGPTRTRGASLNGVLENMERKELRGSDCCSGGSKETHICDKCCAEFFTWFDLNQHQKVCTEDPLVLIVKDDYGMGAVHDRSPGGASPGPSVALSDSSVEESTDEGLEAGEPSANHNESLLCDVLEEEQREPEEPMELEPRPEIHQFTARTGGPPPPDRTGSGSPQRSSAGTHNMPSTNVTLEILQSTRVAVAQFSQGISSGGGKAASVAIPVILEHLLALQQQQVRQLQLIEQIRSQVAVMNRQPTQAALNPVSRALSLAPTNSFPSQGLISPPVLPLSGAIPSSVNGQASVSSSPNLETSQTLTSQNVHRLSAAGDYNDVMCTSAYAEKSAAVSVSSYTSQTPALPPPYMSAQTGGVSGTQMLSSSNPLAPGQQSGLFCSSSSSLPFLPHSPPSGVIFPNPLASIAATAHALDPIAALLKHRKGKLPNVSLFNTKPSPEEPFFKHKCRFCAKVFGSDSALQIHLRSHTGERPFKCNICGNRFSTKGNLKVHFQRHKEKYPHVQMNPYPVPEYLDNVPTSSGIPYGMTFPAEKPGSSWLDSKPVVATLPTPIGLPLSSALTSIGSSNDPLSVTPSIKSPYRPSSGECVSLSPTSAGSEPHMPPVSESPQLNCRGEAPDVLKTEGVPLPQNCIQRLMANPVTVATGTSTATAAHTPSVSTTPEPICHSSPVSHTSHIVHHSDPPRFSPDAGLLDSTHASETSMLERLVENIDRKVTDPNQCVVCHRVLSCQSALKMHYRIHTGDRPFKCKICGRAFTTKGNLKSHVGIHRETPPVLVQHSCPICQKKFTNAVVLQQHIRMHMGGALPEPSDLEDHRDVDGSVSLPENNNFDSLSSNDNDLADDISIEDDGGGEEEEEGENMEEEEEEEAAASPAKRFSSPCCSPPRSSAVVSSIAALENQMRMIDSTVNLNHSFGITALTNGFMDRERLAINCFLTEKRRESGNAGSPTFSDSSDASVSPCVHKKTSDGRVSKSPTANHRPESQEPLAALVKMEQSESPSSASVVGLAQDLRGLQPSKMCVKEESPYSTPFLLGRERASGQILTSLANSMSSGPIKTEMNGHSQPIEGHHHPAFSLLLPPSYPPISSPGMTSLLGPAPPRRTPKQHNCHACGKNFSSASALQIHERTHTGEKPFVCSICGRAFTTKGNLKVHMGTHMWNNAPARRGRRLSVENPIALLGGDPMKFGEMFQKDLAARAMNVDPGFWNRYAAAITTGLAMKNHHNNNNNNNNHNHNEISVIQNRGGGGGVGGGGGIGGGGGGGGGIPQLHAMTAAMDRATSGGVHPLNGLGKTSAMDLGPSRHFSMLIDDGKEIGIN